MTSPTNSPPPEPGEEQEQPRPDLQVVREPELFESTEPTEPTEEPGGDVSAENDGDEAEPLLDSNGDPVTPQAPLDVQLRESLVRSLHGIPAFGQAPASFAEAIEYSQTGDWATSSNGAKRAVHGLATVITFVVTWPLVDLLGRHRTKPGPFAVAVLSAFVLLQIVIFAL